MKHIVKVTVPTTRHPCLSLVSDGLQQFTLMPNHRRIAILEAAGAGHWQAPADPVLVLVTRLRWNTTEM